MGHPIKQDLARFKKIVKGKVRDSDMCMQAGNSIVVNVLQEINKYLYI